MSGIELALRTRPTARLDLWRLTPDRLFPLNLEKIEKLGVGSGRDEIRVGDLFRVRTIKQDVLRFVALDHRCDGVAQGMRSGTIEADGDVGAWAGAGMEGGNLRVSGDAGAGAGASMSGGHIEIGGDAGDGAAGPKPTSMLGMQGGTLVVRGKSGHRIGERMRRGLVILEGKTGDDVGARMVAGTVVIMRGAGLRTGIAARRGSLVLAREPDDLLPSFVDCGVAEFTYLRLLAGELERLGVHARFSGRARRLMGDMAAKGKGEILIAR